MSCVAKSGQVYSQGNWGLGRTECFGPGSSTEGGAIRTIRLIKRQFVEMPQPAKALFRCFFASIALCFLVGALKGPGWLLLLIGSVIGLSIFLFGLCIFRDINGAATGWSLMYKESKGIPPEGFTFADVPTIKFMGFMYMCMGVLAFVGMALEAFR
jgi:hypothetical protein